MSLNISNMLNTLKGFYDTQSRGGEKYTASKEDIGNLVAAYGMAEVNDVELTAENLSKDISILSNTEKITISSQTPQNFSYKTDDATGKVIIFGNNLTIDIPSGSEKYVEVVGISNVINSKDIDDNITLFGYDNKVNTNEGDDTVTVFGEDNVINNAEIIKIEDKENIFASVTSNWEDFTDNAKGSIEIANTRDNEPVRLDVDGKQYLLKVNQSTTIVPEKVTVEYELNKTTGEITFKGDNFTVIANNSQTDLIKLVGNKCVVETGDENDIITVEGEKNIIHSGEGADDISVNGKNNEVYADEGNDEVTVNGSGNIISAEKVNYTEQSGSILLAKGDDASHYINVVVDGIKYEYLIQRNSNASDDVSVEYQMSDDGILTINGSNVKVISQNDEMADKIALIGDNIYVDAGDGNDIINVKGNNSVIITGDGADRVVINGNDNQVIGDDADIVDIQSGKNKGFEDVEVIYSTQNGSIVLSKDDTSSHYINVEIENKTYKFLIQRNTSSDDDVSITYTVADDGKLTVTGNNVKVISQNDGAADNLTLIGNNNYVDAADGNDSITIKGNNSSVVAGDGADTITLNGDNNQVSGDENDVVNIAGGKNKGFEDVEVNYTSKEGSIVLSADDKSSHYINVGGFSYLVERNSASTDDVTLTYKMNDDGQFELTGNNFKMIAQKDGVADKIKVTGDNIYVDAGDGDDKIDVIGNKNVVIAGDGDDNVYVEGSDNEIQGGLGTDSVAIGGNNNTYEDVEYIKQVVTLTKDWQSETVKSNGFEYTFHSTKELAEDEKLVVIYEYRDGQAIIQADNVIVYAGNGQADNILFEGKNSKIFAMDKDDVINVKGDNNYVDGWTGNDKITVEGLNNKVYGFLGDDEINIIQRENTAAEIDTEKQNISLKDAAGNERTDAEIEKLAKENLLSKGANFVDGEKDTDTVDASKYTKVSVNTEIYKSLSQTLKINPDESEKRIIVDDKTYIIKNYATKENNNPFVSTRSISYDIVDVEVDGEIQKQLVVKGDFISVEAEDGQNDNVKLIGDNSYLNLADGMDFLEAKGNYNLLFGGLGKDYLKVEGSNNVINGDFDDMSSENDDDVIEVIGDKNTIKGGHGNDTLSVDGEDAIWDDIEVITGLTKKRETLTNDMRETEITCDDGKTYTIKVNEEDDVELEEDVKFTYSVVDGVLTIKGDKIHVIAKQGQQDNIKLIGDDCIIELGDEDDIIDAFGSRNEIRGGAGDDTIKVYGDEIKVYGEAGKDKFDVRALHSEIYADDETATAGSDDELLLTGNETNKYIGFTESKIVKNPDEGLVVLSKDCLKGDIKIKDIDGKEIKFHVEPNIMSPQKLEGEIYVDYEVKDFVNEKGETKRQIIIKGSDVMITLAESDDSVYVKLIGSDIRFESFGGDDVIDVEGAKNEIFAGEGQNTININGNNNKANGGKSIDKFDVKGNYNEIIGNGEADEVILSGINNNYSITPTSARKGGSLILSKEIGPQTIVIDNMAYEISMYGIENSLLNETEISVNYVIEDDQVVFTADNIMIRVIDSRITPETDENLTENRNTLKLIGNNCYVFSGYGDDVIKVEGDNNILDGWYGDDSFEVIGNNNDIRGFDGDDIITITKGDNNIVDGEAGIDTLTVIEGEGNTYRNIDKIQNKK